MKILQHVSLTLVAVITTYTLHANPPPVPNQQNDHSSQQDPRQSYEENIYTGYYMIPSTHASSHYFSTDSNNHVPKYSSTHYAAIIAASSQTTPVGYDSLPDPSER